MNLRLEKGIKPWTQSPDGRKIRTGTCSLRREPAEEKVGKKLTRMTAIAEHGAAQRASFMSESPSKPEMQGQ